ncbi:hypothetical protein [Salinarchaeum laminariae]|uniref:hypothetical protein n=1 Tax=Salinarchaeum laminariae TaxID=869888 RepID=UPI0020C18121|nr:hypothetical protein [Salinarchaeum laminariae]
MTRPIQRATDPTASIEADAASAREGAASSDGPTSGGGTVLGGETTASNDDGPLTIDERTVGGRFA